MLAGEKTPARAKSQENDHLRGRVSAVTVLEDGEKEGASTFYQYDPHGNVKKLIQLLPNQATDPNSTPIIRTVDYVYDLISGKVNKVYYQKDNGLTPHADQFVHRYDYDADNRLRTVYTSNDDWTWYKEATYLYYAHGPLARVELGEHTVQGLDYYYTLQGWLKGVNAPFDLTKDAGKDGYGTAGGVNREHVSRDAFGFTLGYFDEDYTPIGAATEFGAAATSAWTGLKSNTATNKSAVGLYNGNIAWMATNLNTSKITHTGLQVMAYRYDQLNRIVSTQANVFNGSWDAHDRYKETFSYDPNGNILSLNRNGETGSPIDQLAYNYNNPFDNNRLDGVTDNSGSGEGLKTSANYTYDAIGNLVTDSEEGINPIEWTVYGKVSKATKGATTIEYKYDGMGHRVVKKTNTKTTYYVRDASGNVMAIYEQLNAQTQINLTEQPIYGSSRIGIYHGQGAQRGATEMGVRQYELSNHLQNTLITLSDNKLSVDGNSDNLADFYEARILSATDYYAFGMSMKGRTWQSEKYRYGFNGKENDSDWEVQDYGFRIYKPELGKFLSVDPLTKSYPELTPYQFASNNPIHNIDLDGLEGVKYDVSYTNSKGKTKIKTVVEFDVHVGITNKFELKYQNQNLVRSSLPKLKKVYNSHAYNIDDVGKIQEDFVSQYNKFKVSGKEVEFKLNMHTFDIDAISLGDYAKSLRTSTLVETASPNLNGGTKPIINSETGKVIMRNSITGVAIGILPTIPGEGETILNRVGISPNATDAAHTQRHELGHFLLLGSPKNPVTEEEHLEMGGVFKYKVVDPNGKVISPTEKVSQQNVKDFLNHIPLKKQ
ncbi:MAG: hypothetical protein EAZ08_00695 [Cytophagales bacterium]|nr:MAG: hypothetical protein EAZ08_00695 [Cytophagales bacterium]